LSAYVTMIGLGHGHEIAPEALTNPPDLDEKFCKLLGVLFMVFTHLLSSRPKVNFKFRAQFRRGNCSFEKGNSASASASFRQKAFVLAKYSIKRHSLFTVSHLGQLIAVMGESERLAPLCAVTTSRLRTFPEIVCGMFLAKRSWSVVPPQKVPV